MRPFRYYGGQLCVSGQAQHHQYFWKDDQVGGAFSNSL